MRVNSFHPILTAITVLLMLPTAKADVATYLGKWQVDVPATIEAAKQSPKYKPEEDDKMAAMIERMLGSMTLTLDESNVTYARGSKALDSRPYTFKGDANGATTITVMQGEKTITLEFTLDEGKRMHVKSSASHDMDFYVWKRFTGDVGQSPTEVDMMAAAMGTKGGTKPATAKPVPTIEQNLATLLTGAKQYSLETGKDQVSYDTLAKGGYFKPLQPVNGEDYATAIIDLSAGTVSVTDKAGVVHSAK